MFLRVVIGFCSMAVVVVSFVLCVELVSGKWRTIIGILNIFPVAIAYIICAGISYYTYHWRTMQFVISSPTLLLLCLWFKMPESPRWVCGKVGNRFLKHGKRKFKGEENKYVWLLGNYSSFWDIEVDTWQIVDFVVLWFITNSSQTFIFYRKYYSSKVCLQILAV